MRRPGRSALEPGGDRSVGEHAGLITDLIWRGIDT